MILYITLRYCSSDLNFMLFFDLAELVPMVCLHSELNSSETTNLSIDSWWEFLNRLSAAARPLPT